MDMKLIFVLLMIFEFSNQAEMRSYFINLLPNEKHNRIDDLTYKHNNRSSSQGSSPQRSLVNVLEEKQLMLDEDLTALKDHLTKLERRFGELLQQKKQTEKANEDLKWAIGSLRKSILNIENDVVQFKNDKKNSVIDMDEFRDLEHLRLTVTSLQGRMERLEKEEKRKEEALANIWTYIKSFAEKEKLEVRHGHHYHNHNYQTIPNKGAHKNVITSNEIPDHGIAPSPSSSSSSSSSSGESRGNSWTTKFQERLTSLEGKVRDLNDNKSLQNQEDLLLAKFDQLQSKMMNMKNDLNELKVEEKQRKKLLNEEINCYNIIRKTNLGEEFDSKQIFGQESSTPYDLDKSPDVNMILKRIEDLESKVLILQMNSTINQSNDVNKDLKLRLDLAHVAFQSSELANHVFQIRSTVKRLSKDIQMWKENSSLIQTTIRKKTKDNK